MKHPTTREEYSTTHFRTKNYNLKRKLIYESAILALHINPNSLDALLQKYKTTSHKNLKFLISK